MVTHERRILDRDGRPVEVVLPIAEHGLDPNRYDVEEVHRDQVTLAKLQGERSPGA